MTYEPTGAIRRAAVIAYHASPSHEPGAGDSGGMTIYVRHLARALADRGVATDIFTRATEVGAPVRELYPGVRVVALQAGPMVPLAKEELLRYTDTFIAAVEAFARTDGLVYDVIHSHYWQSGLIGRWLADSWDVQLVHSHHTLGLVKNQLLAPDDEPEPEFRLEGERRVIATADVLVASTDEEWEQLSCMYGAAHDRLKVIHPGVDHYVFHPRARDQARARLGLPQGLVVLSAGRIQRLKGLDLAVRAVAEVAAALDEQITFVAVGGASGRRGEDEVARLEALVEELDLGDIVQFRGPKPHEELPYYYSAADALLVCSHTESFGLAALEAQACGTPVVATAVGGLKHIVEDGRSGFLIGSRDPATFAASLKTLLSDPDLRRSMSQAAIDRARSFSWDRTADGLLELYECLTYGKAPELCTC